MHRQPPSPPPLHFSAPITSLSPESFPSLTTPKGSKECVFNFLLPAKVVETDPVVNKCNFFLLLASNIQALFRPQLAV